MKEFINFYYGINVDTINQLDDYYYFKYNNSNYFFIPFNQDNKRLNTYLNISNMLNKYNIKSHLIVNNKEGNLVSSIDDVNYLLMKPLSFDKDISIFDIIDNQNTIKQEGIKIDKNYHHWSSLWIAKVDFIENSLGEVKEDKIIKYSIDYYIGLCENAIMYYQKTMNEYFDSNYLLTWSHRRIYYPNKGLNYFNPINYIIDYDVRDQAEYLKACFFKDDDNFENEFNSFLKVFKANNYNANLFFARLLYPSYYFDIYEKWLNNKCSSDKLLTIINKQEKYMQFLKKAYQILSEYALMIPIDYFK